MFCARRREGAQRHRRQEVGRVARAMNDRDGGVNVAAGMREHVMNYRDMAVLREDTLWREMSGAGRQRHRQRRPYAPDKRQDAEAGTHVRL